MMSPDFASYALDANVRFHPSVDGKILASTMDEIMSRLTLACMDAGATLIGHIKCFADAGSQGFIQVSITDPAGRPIPRGKLNGDIEEMDLVLNVLLYGLSKERIRSIADELVKGELQLLGGELTPDEGTEHEEHEHHHDDHCHAHHRNDH